jgi:hypothetical protein
MGERKGVTLSATLAPSIAVQPAGTRSTMRATAAVRAPRPTPATSMKPVAVAAAPLARSAALGSPITPSQPDSVIPAPAPPPPIRACAPDEQRLRNYAAAMVQGLGVVPSADLKLFEDDGRPLGNLARVMLAMSSFELGTLRASAGLVAAAIARATPAPAANAVAAAAPPEGAPPVLP